MSKANEQALARAALEVSQQVEDIVGVDLEDAREARRARPQSELLLRPVRGRRTRLPS